MGMKFLNKKGWHTGSLRNIENVWKAEQKHEAEQKKLEELRKQIHEERERNEFRQLQEQAGLVPRQERLEFLYDSGLAVGKGSSSGFNALESLPKTVDPGTAAAPSSSSAKPQSAVPGSLFEEKPQSSNDTWRKLHSDPLLMIRQREQEALARVKNNPVKMAMIHKSVEAIKHKDKKEKDESRNKHQDKKSRRHEKDESRNKHQDKESRHHHRKSKRSRNSSPGLPSGSDGDLSEGDYRGKKDSYKDNRFKEQKLSLSRDPEGDNDIGRQKSKSRHDNLEVEKYERKTRSDLPPKHESRYNGDSSGGDYRGKKDSYKDGRFEERKPSLSRDPDGDRDIGRQKSKSRHDNLEVEKYERKTRSDLSPKHESRHNGDTSGGDYRGKKDSYKDNRFEERKPSLSRDPEGDNDIGRQESKSRHDNLEVEKYERKTRSDLPPKHESRYNSRKPVRLTEEERAARLREMQRDAEVHEEQRWKRIKKAEEKDAKEDIPVGLSGGRNFLDAAQRSVYGAVKGGSSTIEESVRRRTHYLQGRSEATEGNAFRR